MTTTITETTTATAMRARATAPPPAPVPHRPPDTLPTSRGDVSTAWATPADFARADTATTWDCTPTCYGDLALTGTHSPTCPATPAPAEPSPVRFDRDAPARWCRECRTRRNVEGEHHESWYAAGREQGCTVYDLTCGHEVASWTHDTATPAPGAPYVGPRPRVGNLPDLHATDW